MAGREESYQLRREKLERLRTRGVDPYPPRFRRTHTARQAVEAFLEWEKAKPVEQAPEVTVAGRLTAMRDMGKATFADLRDGSGRIQVYLKSDALGAQAYAMLEDIDLGDFLGAHGRLFRTRAGEVTVEAAGYVVLAKSLRPLPEKWHGLVDTETRYRQRYLDLVANEEVRDLFRTRVQIIAAIRQYMNDRGFLEVETPVLLPEAGGAAARPFVTHHRALDRDLYLRIATELYLKRLIIGGFDKVYEIGRIFRNEGISTKHNPEFTMMESYEAYADYNDVAAMVEELVAYVAQEVLGTTRLTVGESEIDLAPPWRRLTVHEALREYVGLELEQYRRDEAGLRAVVHGMGIEVPEEAGWAKLIDELLSERVEPRLIEPTFLMDYPAPLSPLAKRKAENPDLVERFEPFAGGLELGNAYTELNDPLDQRERFLEQSRRRAAGEEEVEMLDEDFLLALEHGMPPTGGLGIGIDRLVMLLTGQRSIREVILFPQLRTKD
ncbi:MAG: lysine--tRNA ligase [Dehalococcoidia bacterium]|nr:lysine--tRNA ligase [Dehalococcoidia bacterium]